MQQQPPSDLDLHNLLRRCWSVPEAYPAFCAAVWPFLAATLFYYDGNIDRVNEACQEALEALQGELRRDWDDKRNYLLQLIALAHDALGRRKRPKVYADIAAQFEVSLVALFSALYLMIEGGARRCSWIWREHLLIKDGDQVTLESCRATVQRWILRIGFPR
jgi:hypothetical protein